MLIKCKNAGDVNGCYDYDNSNEDVYAAFLKLCSDERFEPIIFEVSDTDGMDPSCVWAQTPDEFFEKLQTDVYFRILHAEFEAYLYGEYVRAWFNFDDKYICVGGDSDSATGEFVQVLREYID